MSDRPLLSAQECEGGDRLPEAPDRSVGGSRSGATEVSEDAGAHDPGVDEPGAAPELLTTLDLARRWRTTEQALYAARYRGDGPRAIRVGRRLLFRLDDVEAWEDARAEPPSSRTASPVARGPALVHPRATIT